MDSSNDLLRVDLLGPLSVSADSVAVRLGGPKQRAAFAYLAVNCNRAQSGFSIAEAVWDSHPPDGWRSSLQVVVSNLRKQLRETSSGAANALVTSPPGYRLNLSLDNFDLGRFTAQRGFAATAAYRRQFDVASEHYSSALREWKGQPLSDLAGMHFVNVFTATVAEQHVLTLAAYAECELACNRIDHAIEITTGPAESNPLREPLWQQLISALYLSGRQSDALNRCRQLRAALSEELGLDPGRAIQELEQTILRQEPLKAQEAAVATAAVALTVVGELPSSRAHIKDSAGSAYPVTPSGISIGRHPDNDVVLAQGKVSRHHAVIIDGGASYVIRDLDSSNGVFVSGQRVEDSAVLRHGDTIRLGDSVMTFVE